MHQVNRSQARRHLDSLRHDPQHLFAGLLNPALVQDALAQEHAGWRDGGVYTPCVTLWTFLGQVLGSDHSCRAAVARLMATLVAGGEEPCSPETGPYCKARQRLPVGVLSRLTRQIGQLLEAAADPDWLFQGRRVQLVDGTTVSMPDTPKNQRAFPQNSAQKPGLGFPIARLVALISLATGAVRDLALGPYQGKETGETALLRTLWDHLCRGDILLGDRCFASFLGIAPLLERGVDGVFRMHQRRQVDFRRGKHLGVLDHVVTWKKPTCPDWMDQATYDQIPDQITVRELRVPTQQPGFRVAELVLVTTLLDPAAYPKDEVVGLYLRRWQIELDLRSIKVEMQMDVLRCKTPEMVEKEVWAHLLAYNAVRSLMAEAADQCEAKPRRLSFKGALQTVCAFDEVLRQASPTRRVALEERRRRAIARHRVGGRPGRFEPRAKKRRPNQHRLLMVPRHEARKALLQNK